MTIIQRTACNVLGVVLLAASLTACASASSSAFWAGLADGMAAASAQTPVPGFPASPELLLFGGNNHRVFLGCLNCSKFDAASVFNQFGTHGSKYSSDSIFNRFGEYGSRYSAYSACNPYATDPPVVVDRNGNYYGRLTISKFGDPVRNNSIVAWLAGVCAAG